jgi:hypothetical protein
MTIRAMTDTHRYGSRRPGVDLPQAPEPLPPPRLGSRVLGWTLMTFSLGLVSCQSLFVL